MAIGYTDIVKKGKLVNAESAYIISDSEEPMGICSQRHLSAMIDTDSYTIHRKAKPISKKVIWSSSNPKIANVYGDSYCEVIYAAEYDFKEMSIAPHWYQNQFAPM